MKPNKIVSLIVVAAVGFSLTSCNLYKKFEGADAPAATDSLFRYVQSTSDTSTIASIGWREFFADSYLQELIEEGLENNSDVRIARSRVNQATAALTSAKLAYLPSLNFAPQATATSFASASATTYNIGGAAEWEIDIFGKLTAAKNQSKAILEQSIAYKQTVETQIIASIANSYYSLLMLDTQSEIAQSTAQNWQENLKTMKALKRFGSATQAAVSQAQANKLSVDASVVEYKKQIEQLENIICGVLGRAPQKIERSTLKSQKFPTEVALGVPIQLLSNRPDVKSAEYNLASAYYGVSAARAAFYPSIKIGGAAGWSNGSGTMIIDPASALLSATASLVQPLFNKGKLKANLEISKETQEQALITFNQTVLNAGVEVNNALLDWQTALKQKEITKERISSLERAVESTELLMQYSNQNYLDVLVARNSLLQAKISEVSDQTKEIQGVISLYRALGGGSR